MLFWRYGVKMLLLLLAAAAPAKLVIVNANQPPAIVSYPSMERCERARAALMRQAYNPNAGKVEQVPGGGLIMNPPQQLKAYCIPS